MKQLLFALAVLLLPAGASGVPLGVQVSVFRDSGSGFAPAGVAFGGGGTLEVLASPGDSIRLDVAIRGTPSDLELSFYGVEISADDPGEIDYLVGSGVELTGLGFDRSPDTTLADANPEVGVIRSLIDETGVPYEPDQHLFRITYIAQAITSDLGADLSVELTDLASLGENDSVDAASGLASVRFVPEPSTAALLALGLGLLSARSRRAALRT